MCSRSSNDRRDEPGGSRSKNIVAVHLAPFIATRRSIQMGRPVIDVLATIPIGLVHPGTLLPFLVLNILMIVVVVLREEDSTATENHRESRESESFFNPMHICSWGKIKCHLVGALIRENRWLGSDQFTVPSTGI
jgi:hypothetical protein